MEIYNVQFYFEESHKEPVQVQAAEGESVLDVALENDIELNHNCGGVCACSTCHVYIEDGMDHLPEITDREEDYIDRANNPTIDSRLGCQCEIHGDIVVRIPDQSKIISS
jgi:2Fe-2S ferredoxin